MSISERTIKQMTTATVIAAVLALVLSPSDPSFAMLPLHPAWVIAIVGAARYGVRGLYTVPAVVIGGQLAVWVSGNPELAMIARLARPGEFSILLMIAALAAIGSSHESRIALLESRLRGAEQRAAAGVAAFGNLCKTSLALRQRLERSHLSLAFLSDLAARIDEHDIIGAGDAALELAMARTGARCAFVQVMDGGRLRMLCSRGAWSANRTKPPSVFRDLVANAAIDRIKAVAAHEVEQSSTDDSDLAAPLLDASGATIGVVALRGVPFSALTLGAREDLATVARWTGRVFAKAHRGSRPDMRGTNRAKN